MTGDRGTYPVQTTVRKQGRTLTFDNVGTHAQVGAINVGFAAWRGAILGTINVLMLADQMGCIGGAARACRFDPEPGTITCPDWGAAVSPAGVYATETAISLGNAVVTKMMLASSDETMRSRALTPDGAQWRCHFVAGDNQRGDYYVGGMGDNMLGGGGALLEPRRRVRQRPLLDPRGPRPERRGLRGRLADPLPLPPRALRLRRRRPLPRRQRRRDRLHPAQGRVVRSACTRTRRSRRRTACSAATRPRSCARA